MIRSSIINKLHVLKDDIDLMLSLISLIVLLLFKSINELSTISTELKYPLKIVNNCFSKKGDGNGFAYI